MEQEKKETVLSVQDLRVSFKTDDGLVHAVRGVSFDLNRGETLCIVGESGSGKSVTSKTIMGILPSSAVIEHGKVLFEGEDLTKIAESEFHRIRGHKIGMIFQDPLSSLNPIMKVGKQITEAMLAEKNHIKIYKEKLISKELSAYNNRKVQCDSEILRSKTTILASDASFEERINTLKSDLKSAEDKLLLIHDKEELNKQLLLVKELRAKTKKEVAQLLQQKKAEHKRLSKLSKQDIKKAKDEYKKEAPVLKKALDERKKKAALETKEYRASLLLKYQENLKKTEAEEKAALDKKEKEISMAVKNLGEKASRVLATQQIESLKKEKAELEAKFRKEKKRIHQDYKDSIYLTKATAKRKAIEIMREVGIPQPEKRFKQYPFEFSGGMRQRIVIAIALTADPEILICDEPTTALDVTIQAQILELINRLKKERNMSIIFITHDLGVVANMADRVAVMYAGKIVEVGTVNEIFYDPRHPYTWALLSSIPDLDSKESLEAIPGTPPYLLNPPKGDAFATRNKYALAIDFKEEPPFFQITNTHYAATWLLDKRAPKAVPPAIVRKRIHASLERAGIHHEQD